MIVTFASSQRLYDLDFYKDILRKTARKYEDVTLRVPGNLSVDAAELFEFCEALGWKIEKWRIDTEWGTRYADVIRDKGMLRGYVYHPHFAEPPKILPPTDLCLVFRGHSDGDRAKEVADHALKMGRAISLHIYREKWTKKKGKDSVFKHIVHITRDPNFTLKLGKERIVYVPGQERKAA